MRFLLELCQARGTSSAVAAQIPVAFARVAHEAEPSLRDEAARVFVAALTARGAGRDVQLGIVQGLSLLGDDDEDPTDVQIRRALEQTSRDGERSTRHVALFSLARCASRAGTGAQGNALAEAREFLLARLSRGADAERPWAALGLAVLEVDRPARGAEISPAVVAALRLSLEKDDGPTQAGAYCIALGLLGDAASASRILELVRSGDDNLRGYAATALGLLGVREVVPELRRIALEQTRYRPGLLREISIALAMLGDREVVPQLLQRLRAGTSMMETVSTAAALGFVGDARAVDSLLALLSDEKQRTTSRAFAAVALGLLCDKDSMPWNAKLAADSNWLAAPPTLYDPLLGKGVLDLL
jgi:hypothetical protein